jgi:esterase/lipase superfamily enzyme
MRVFVRPKSKAERGFRSRAVMPRTETLAPGLPLTPEHDLVFRGGKIIANLSFVNFYVGGYGAWNLNDMESIDRGLYDAMFDKNLNNVLAQYYPGEQISSKFLGSQVLAGPPPAVVSLGDVKNLVTTLFNAGQLDNIELSSTVLNFMLPSGTILNTNDTPTTATINASLESLGTRARTPEAPPNEPVAHNDEDSTGGLGGYHGSVHVGAAPRTTVYYAVGVYSEQLPDGTANGLPVFDKSWKNVVATFYHELNEARTDPDVEDAIRTGNDPNAVNYLGWTSEQGEECGDFPLFEASPLSQVFQEVALTDGSGTVPVQFLYSNATHGPEGPIAAPEVLAGTKKEYMSASAAPPPAPSLPMGHQTYSGDTRETTGTFATPVRATPASAIPDTARLKQVANDASKSEYTTVRVFYATDRQLGDARSPKRFYANERASHGHLSLGTCEVSIPGPDYHRVGKLEAPSIVTLQFRADPRKHVLLLRVRPREQDVFYQDVAFQVAGSERREAFVFIHGYNVSFEDAARRTAQLAYDLRFNGAPLFYSWPSKAHWWRYAADETNVTWCVPQLEAFLGKLAKSAEAETIHLIAHSMGNRALTAAMQLIVAKRAVSKGLFRHIVLTAPDIDEETFQDLAAAIAPGADRLTMYSNYKDRALLMSKIFHLYRRAGASIVIVPGMDTIDASKVDTSLVRHSYFGNSRTVLADVSSLIQDGKPPGKRFGMSEKQKEGKTYYAFRP